MWNLFCLGIDCSESLKKQLRRHLDPRQILMSWLRRCVRRRKDATLFTQNLPKVPVTSTQHEKDQCTRQRKERRNWMEQRKRRKRTKRRKGGTRTKWREANSLLRVQENPSTSGKGNWRFCSRSPIATSKPGSNSLCSKIREWCDLWGLGVTTRLFWNRKHTLKWVPRNSKSESKGCCFVLLLLSQVLLPTLHWSS